MIASTQDLIDERINKMETVERQLIDKLRATQ